MAAASEAAVHNGRNSALRVAHLLDVAVSRGTRNRLAVIDRGPARHLSFEVTLVPGKLVWSCLVTRTAAKSSFSQPHYVAHRGEDRSRDRVRSSSTLRRRLKRRQNCNIEAETEQADEQK
jgi:hypothetical protein